MVSLFSENIIRVVEITISYQNPRGKKRRIPWWNNEIRDSIKEKNNALKTFQRTHKLEDHIKLKELRAKIRYLVKK